MHTRLNAGKEWDTYAPKTWWHNQQHTTSVYDICAIILNYLTNVQNNKYKQPTFSAYDQNIRQPLLIK